MSLWLAWLLAIGSSLVLLIGVWLDARPNLLNYGAIALISWWIIVAIRREHVYVRELLILLFGAWVIYEGVLAVLTREWAALGNDSGVSYVIVVLCLLIWSQDVAAYYRELRARNKDAAEPLVVAG